jgi:hypothetical protein
MFFPKKSFFRGGLSEIPGLVEQRDAVICASVSGVRAGCQTDFSER